MLVSDASWYHDFHPPARVEQGDKVGGLGVQSVRVLYVLGAEGHTSAEDGVVGVEIGSIAKEKLAPFIQGSLALSTHIIVGYLRFLEAYDASFVAYDVASVQAVTSYIPGGNNHRRTRLGLNALRNKYLTGVAADPRKH